MVGSEVDHKYLGRFAKSTVALNTVLSAGLYKLLGLSTLLSRKLLRARKQRKLDPTRPTKSLDLYRHILWMAREGLSILRNDVLPELANHLPPPAVPAGTGAGAGVGVRSAYAPLNELQVLALKMHASFLHILVLFDHTYQTKPLSLPAAAATATAATSTSSSAATTAGAQTKAAKVMPAKVTPALAAYAHMAPTIDAFNRADVTASRLLPSSHPLRLSVKVEFAAFTYDCTRDYETSRRIAKTAVEEALSSLDPVDDESFEDAMESTSPPPGTSGWMGKLRLVLEWSGH